MPLKNSCSMVEKQPEAIHTFLWHFFPSLIQNFIAYRSSSRPDCIFEIQQLWQSGFSRVYSNSCCSCSVELEIIEIGQSSYKMYSNNILDFQMSTTILHAHTKKVWKLILCTSYLPHFTLSLMYSSEFQKVVMVIPSSWCLPVFWVFFAKYHKLRCFLGPVNSVSLLLYL